MAEIERLPGSLDGNQRRKQGLVIVDAVAFASLEDGPFLEPDFLDVSCNTWDDS